MHNFVLTNDFAMSTVSRDIVGILPDSRSFATPDAPIRGLEGRHGRLEDG